MSRFGRFLRANPLIATGGVIALLIVLIAVVAPLVVPYPADAGAATHPETALLAPSAQHLFGTDQVGRDLFSRVLEGARVSPLVALFVLLIACAVGISLGVLAGYFGGITDEIIMRITDIFLAFPPLLLALAFATVLPANLTSLTIAIAISWWPWYTRLVRGQAASVAGRPYVEACRALGIPSWRILLRHVLPNSVTPVIVQVSLDVGGVILTASALSFLGLGAQREGERDRDPLQLPAGQLRRVAVQQVRREQHAAHGRVGPLPGLGGGQAVLAQRPGHDRAHPEHRVEG